MITNYRPPAADNAAGSGWQACCIGSGMNNTAYDISDLLELEAHATAVSEFRSARPVVKPVPSGAAAAQEALSRELLQMFDSHEALIQQYLRIADDSLLENDC